MVPLPRFAVEDLLLLVRVLRRRRLPLERLDVGDDADLYWFYHLLSGAITVSWARTGRIDRLSGGACRSDDFESIAQQMIAVFSHGLDDRPA